MTTSVHTKPTSTGFRSTLPDFVSSHSSVVYADIGLLDNCRSLERRRREQDKESTKKDTIEVRIKSKRKVSPISIGPWGPNTEWLHLWGPIIVILQGPDSGVTGPTLEYKHKPVGLGSLIVTR